MDRNGDGVAEQMTLLKTGLWWPNGIAWRNNSLYVTGFYNDTGVMQGYIARWDDIDSFALNNLVRARLLCACLACSHRGRFHNRRLGAVRPCFPPVLLYPRQTSRAPAAARWRRRTQGW